MKVQSLLFGFFLLNVISLELFAQTGINTNYPLSRLEIKGSSSLPGTA